MDKRTALQALGLDETASTEEIQAALTAKKQDVATKKASAPTDALKAKFETIEAKLADAEKALSADPGRSQPAGDNAPATPAVTPASSSVTPAQAGVQNPSPLSQTKLADLPGLAPQDAAQVELQSGQIIADRYEIKELIGQGGMGAVYRAFDKNRDEDIAIKVLLPSLTKNERALERFLNEARISSKLSHPNIVNVFDVQNALQANGSGDLYFLTMELLEGLDLRQVMDNQKIVKRSFDIDDVKDYLKQICDGLSYSHETTVHRDIKPENIWVTEEGKIKIMDFGIAQLQSTSQRTQTGAAMGTAYYMAPEQLKGRSDIDGRADQYAVAVLAYELLTEEVPAGVIEPIGQLRNDIPPGMASAIMKAMSARPENRFDDMLAFKEALLSGGTTKKKRPVLGGEGNGATLISRKNKWLALGAAAVFLVGIGIVINLERMMLSRYDAYLIFPDRVTDPGQLTPDQLQEVLVLDTKYRFISNSDGKFKVTKGQEGGEYKVSGMGRVLSFSLKYEGGRYLVSSSEQAESYAVLPLERADLDWYEANRIGKRDQFLDLDFLPPNDELCPSGYKKGSDGQLVSYEASDPEAPDLLISQRGDLIRFSGDGESIVGLEYRLVDGRVRFAVDVGEENIATPGKPSQWSSVLGIYECELSAGGKYRLAGYLQTWLEQKRESQRAFAKALNLDWVKIPGGTFQMGSKKEEDEQPVHTVQVPAFQMMSKEVTVGQFRQFVEDTGYRTTAEKQGDCYGFDDKWKYKAVKGRSWRNPGFNQNDNHPVVCISWWDAIKFSEWVGASAGISAALPSEAQWEYAARGGSGHDYHFGNNTSQLCRYANVADKTPLPNGKVWTNGAKCSDGYHATAPSGHYQPNQYGLYDMHGNVWEWTQDCWRKNYHGAPGDGDAWHSGDCSKHVLRGGSWNAMPDSLRLTNRYTHSASDRTYDYGFRLVLDR